MTGAPKIRAMEIIDELEPLTRGPYTGCLGYLGFNRDRGSFRWQGASGPAVASQLPWVVGPSS